MAGRAAYICENHAADARFGVNSKIQCGQDRGWGSNEGEIHTRAKAI